jgi:carboxyl-terminal processing protease
MLHGLPRLLLWLAVSWFAAFSAVAATAPASAEEAASPSDESSEDAAAAAAAQREREQKDYELLRLFSDALDQIESNYVQEVDRRTLIEGAIEGMISKLDPYSDFIAPSRVETFRNSIEAEYGGIGIQVEIVEGELVISSSLVGGPAYRAGLLAGDKIIKIGEEETAGITRTQAIEKLRGPLGSSVTFTVQQPGSAHAQAHTLSREVIRLDTVMGDHRRRDHRWEFLLDPAKKIGYVRITTFSRNTADELRTALVDLTDRGMKGLVLDLRDNPGGVLASAIEVADLFVRKGRIVSTSGRAAPEKKWDAHDENTFDGFPIAVLVNNYSASASEIVAACLQDHELAVIVGQRSWGKGSVQNLIYFDEGQGALKLTTAGYLRPSGKNIHRAPGQGESDEWGVKPNEGLEVILSAPELKQLREYRKEHDIARRPVESAETEGLPKYIDPQLQRALTYLDEKLGLGEMATAQAPEEPAPAK